MSSPSDNKITVDENGKFIGHTFDLEGVEHLTDPFDDSISCNAAVTSLWVELNLSNQAQE